MKTVLQCDYCQETWPVDEVEEIQQHEHECSFNPIHENCFTCAYSGDEPDSMDFFDKCIMGEEIKFMNKVMDGKQECLNWALEI